MKKINPVIYTILEEGKQENFVHALRPPSEGKDKPTSGEKIEGWRENFVLLRCKKKSYTWPAYGTRPFSVLVA